jgi:2-polyprenyl-3-methyl-5-hydroxy-6-metoxy-1,4-benzoquinol methylase
VDDVEAPWTYTEKFDFIYSRMMIGSLADVPSFITQSLENLNPGGWLEMADIAYPVKINDGDFPKDSAHVKWYVPPTSI